MSLIYKKGAAMKAVIGAKLALLRSFLRFFAHGQSSTNRGKRSVVFWGILIIPFFITGCETTAGNPKTLQSSTGAAPMALVPSSNVSRLQAWQDASTVAARGEGRASLVGAGESMNPVYGDTTMLVVTPIAYEKLQAGMTVVYINRHGRRVAHQLVAKGPRGWTAKGINNEVEDAEWVTPDNLVGVVYASMSSDTKD